MRTELETNRPNDIYSVVKHSHHRDKNEWRSEGSAVMMGEDFGRAKLVRSTGSVLLDSEANEQNDT